MARKKAKAEPSMVRYFVCSDRGPTGWGCGLSEERAILQWIGRDRWDVLAKKTWEYQRSKGYSVRAFRLVEDPTP